MIAKEELPVLGGYQLLEKLGQGGMGAVYKARQLSMDRIVAVKILPPKFSRDPQFVERFQREARLAGRMNHENVVNAFDVGEERGYHYLAMEFVEGTTVGAILKKHGPFAEKEALRICRQVAMALKCAHSNSLIHRDIKPDNIMIDSRGIVKLADMGLARATNEDTSLTQTGMALGTPHYASPEQARGDRDIDHRCDFYSLGATLYHMLTGKTPYEGGSPAAIMAQHLMHDPVPAHERAPERDIGDGASELVMRLMAKNRDDRPRDADELLEMFDLALSGMPPAGALAAESGPKRRTGRHAPVGDSGRDRNRRRTTGHFVPIDAARSVISDRPGKPAARRKGERGAETAAKANPMVLGGAVAAVLLVSAALLMALSGPNSSDKPRSESAAARAPDSEPPVPAAAAAPAVAPAPVRPAPEVAPRQPEPGRPHPRTHQPRHEPELGEPAGAPIRVHARPAAMPIAQPPQREAEAPRTAVPAPSEAPVQAAPAEPEISADARRGYAYLTDKIAERMKELNVEESTGLLEKALQAQVLAPFRQELKADLDDVAWAGKYLAQAEANVPARAGQTFAHKLGRVAVKGFKDGKVELGIDRQGVLAEPMAKLPRRRSPNSSTPSPA
ncbi:MAG: protein kinase [Planctomycetota bacterium]|nr:protein kinase [Planctomycetota bacterium]